MKFKRSTILVNSFELVSYKLYGKTTLTDVNVNEPSIGISKLNLSHNVKKKRLIGIPKLLTFRVDLKLVLYCKALTTVSSIKSLLALSLSPRFNISSSWDLRLG
ncbi:hypothetical protein [Mycoplasmoides genitalium]|uniref:hypothetical protein n=1 Tax=Mycoplasmoides genitalium TaxID=2097 RepID=UPI001ED933E1|nr:hypothetical protein [Mycoplasmoides genitalium]